MQDEIKQWLNYSLNALCTYGVISEAAASQAMPPQVMHAKISEQVAQTAMIAGAMVGELAGKWAR